MYRISVEDHFDSAHHLPGYDGPCANKHGHRWIIRAEWRFTNKQVFEHPLNMAADLKHLKAILHETIKDLDHIDLNKYIPVPTAENLAGSIYSRLSRQVYSEELSAVEIEESPGTCVRYEYEG